MLVLLTRDIYEVRRLNSPWWYNINTKFQRDRFRRSKVMFEHPNVVLERLAVQIRVSRVQNSTRKPATLIEVLHSPSNQMQK
jgi:hypothetical protein